MRSFEEGRKERERARRTFLGRQAGREVANRTPRTERLFPQGSRHKTGIPQWNSKWEVKSNICKTDPKEMVPPLDVSVALPSLQGERRQGEVEESKG